MALTQAQVLTARNRRVAPGGQGLSDAQVNAALTQDRSAQPMPSPTVGSWTHPAYAGTDPAYAAWLAQADLSSADAVSSAKLRKAQAQTAYDQAMQDILNQGTEGRRNIQTAMLQRGMFGSGETQRRGQEFDSAVNVSKQRALAAETDQFGQADEQLRSSMSNLGMQGTQAVSQAMLRDSMAAYQAQQAALAAQSVPVPAFAPAPQQQQAPQPQQQQQAPQQQVTSTFNPTMPAVPTYNPAANSASLFKAQSLPKPKSGVQPLKLVRKGLQ